MKYTLSIRFALFASLFCLSAESRVIAQTPSIRYTLPRAGKVSLAVYDGKGQQLRTLLSGETQAVGEHSLAWDGLDRLGRAMPVGSYEWRLLLNDGLEAEYLAVVGQTPIDPAQPWVWTVGSHQGPSSVVIGAGSAIYHGSRNSEGPPVLMKLASENGPVLWTRGWQTKGPVDMVELGKHLICTRLEQRTSARRCGDRARRWQAARFALARRQTNRLRRRGEQLRHQARSPRRKSAGGLPRARRAAVDRANDG